MNWKHWAFVAYALLPITFGGGGRVRLSDVKTLTLTEGRWTAGRRNAPVPQLKCVGGCNEYRPSVVQCYNMGFDGRDVQWKCEAELDSRVKFGQIEVTCEGYDYPDDPFILAGSCGLEYSLEWTGKGTGTGSQQNSGGYGWFGGNQNQHGSKAYSSRSSDNKWIADLFIFVVACGIIYVIYKTCVSPPPSSHSSSSTHSDQQPPPYGWRGDGTGANNNDAPPPSYDDCNRSRSQQHSNGTNAHPNGTGSGTRGGGGNFWTGFGTGGILGYLLGGRGSYTQQRYHQPYGSGWGNGGGFFGGGGGNGFFGGRGSSSWGSGGGRSSWSSSSNGGSSSGSRTASGYGGTSRR